MGQGLDDVQLGIYARRYREGFDDNGQCLRREEKEATKALYGHSLCKPAHTCLRECQAVTVLVEITNYALGLIIFSISPLYRITPEVYTLLLILPVILERNLYNLLVGVCNQTNMCHSIYTFTTGITLLRKVYTRSMATFLEPLQLLHFRTFFLSITLHYVQFIFYIILFLFLIFKEP